MNEQEYARVIGQNLKRLLYESGRTQTEVCADLGIKKTTMSSWVNGARIPRMDKIDLLCHYFNCKRSDIMEPHNKEYYLKRDTARVAQEIFDNPDLRILFDAAKDSRPEDLRTAAALLRRFKETNPES